MDLTFCIIDMFCHFVPCSGPGSEGRVGIIICPNNINDELSVMLAANPGPPESISATHFYKIFLGEGGGRGPASPPRISVSNTFM